MQQAATRLAAWDKALRDPAIKEVHALNGVLISVLILSESTTLLIC